MWHVSDSIGSLLASKILVCPGRKKADNKNIRSTPSMGERNLAMVWEAGEHTAEQLSRSESWPANVFSVDNSWLVCGFQSSKAPVPPGTIPDLAHCLLPFKLLVTWKVLVTWYQWYNLFEILYLSVFLKPWAGSICRWVRIFPGHWEKLQDEAVFPVSLYPQCQVWLSE